MRRGLALVVAVAIVAVGAFAVTAWIAGGDDEAAPPPTVTTPPPLARLKIIFPEGFTVRDMADRVAAVREIAIDKRGVTPRITKQAYLRAVDEAVNAITPVAGSVMRCARAIAARSVSLARARVRAPPAPDAAGPGPAGRPTGRPVG